MSSAFNSLAVFAHPDNFDFDLTSKRVGFLHQPIISFEVRQIPILALPGRSQKIRLLPGLRGHCKASASLRLDTSELERVPWTLASIDCQWQSPDSRYIIMAGAEGAFVGEELRAASLSLTWLGSLVLRVAWDLLWALHPEPSHPTSRSSCFPARPRCESKLHA